MKELGWRDIGYHYLIERVKRRNEIFTGRFMTDSGAHTKQQGMNYKSLGICVVGNYDEEEVPLALWQKTVGLVKSLTTLLNIPIENVEGHRDYASYKSCPASCSTSCL